MGKQDGQNMHYPRVVDVAPRTVLRRDGPRHYARIDRFWGIGVHSCRGWKQTGAVCRTCMGNHCETQAEGGVDASIV